MRAQFWSRSGSGGEDGWHRGLRPPLEQRRRAYPFPPGERRHVAPCSTGSSRAAIARVNECLRHGDRSKRYRKLMRLAAPRATLAGGRATPPDAVPVGRLDALRRDGGDRRRNTWPTTACRDADQESAAVGAPVRRCHSAVVAHARTVKTTTGAVCCLPCELVRTTPSS